MAAQTCRSRMRRRRPACPTHGVVSERVPRSRGSRGALSARCVSGSPPTCSTRAGWPISWRVGVDEISWRKHHRVPHLAPRDLRRRPEPDPGVGIARPLMIGAGSPRPWAPFVANTARSCSFVGAGDAGQGGASLRALPGVIARTPPRTARGVRTHPLVRTACARSTSSPSSTISPTEPQADADIP